MSDKGLVSREVIPIGTSAVEIHEVWDMRVPGCPWIALDLWTFKRDETVVHLERTVQMPREIWEGMK